MFWRNFPGGSGTFCQDLLTDPDKRTRLRFKGLLSPLAPPVAGQLGSQLSLRPPCWHVPDAGRDARRTRPDRE
jgi:hypothetical protein